jgi:TM2 domain-containing membrane protein YozV
MSNQALAKRSEGSFWSGAVPAVASGVIPGLGQLLNRDSNKALGIFVVAASGVFFLSHLPLIGGLAWLAGAGAWVYGVVDGYYHGKRRK